MGRITPLFMILLLSAAVPLLAPPQKQESLGDLARQLRAQHEKDAKKATRVFTNDNLPSPQPGEAISSASGPPANPLNLTPTTSKPAASPSSKETSDQPASPEGKQKTRDYWQEKFKAARQGLAKAKELQQLSEDELNLLQIQQAREIDPTAKADLTSKVQAKQSEVDEKKTATDAAQKSLDELENDFKDSGAPDDWSKTE